MPVVTFAISWYKVFMEKKNIIRTICGCKPSTKTKKHFNLIKVLLVFVKNHRDTGWTPKYTEYQRAKIKLQRRLFDQHKVDFENLVCLSKCEEYNDKWNALYKTDSAFCTTIVFHFCLMIITKEKLACILMHCRKILNWNMSFKCCCQCTS